jgi:hypothetical protein
MKIILRLLIAFFALLAVVSLVYMVQKTNDPIGGIDFHSYWYSGHFVRQRTDPYQAYLEGLEPQLPVKYLGGKTVTQSPIAQEGLANTPANTPAMVLLLTPLAFFSWATAKNLWMICNLLFMASTIWLVIRFLPPSKSFDRWQKGLLVLIFISLFGTRNTVVNGQTSLLVFGLMLIVLLLPEKRWGLAGLVFGLALSKYSLALPVFLILLWQKKYRAIAVSFLVQLTGWLVLAIWVKQSPLVIVEEYVQIFQLHLGLPGIHLGSLFPEQTLITWVLCALITLITLGGLGWWVKQTGADRLKNAFSLLMVTNIIMLWTLLIAYHRNYDTVTGILFIGAIQILLVNADRFELSKTKIGGLVILGILSITFLTLPARGISVIERFLPDNILPIWLVLQSASVTITLVVMLIGSIWVLMAYAKQPVFTQACLPEVNSG